MRACRADFLVVSCVVELASKQARLIAPVHPAGGAWEISDKSNEGRTLRGPLEFKAALPAQVPVPPARIF
jgi:hypothetical protein